MSNELESLKTKIAGALEVAQKYGTIDGDHHKMWVIDQMVRTLTDCPPVTKTALGCGGRRYSHETLGESPKYEAFVAGFIEDDEGEKVNHWDVGIAP